MARFTNKNSRTRGVNPNWVAGYQGPQMSAQNYPKHSGAKKVTFENGKSLSGTKGVSAWNWSKDRGFMDILIFQTKFSDELSKSGNVKLAAKVSFRRNGESSIKSCVISKKNGKYYIPALGLVVNPDAPNGGYCGQSKKP